MPKPTPPEPEPPLPFFVYGTLRPGERNHDAHFRGRLAAAEPALLGGAVLYEGPGYPCLVETGDDRRVHGELLTPLPAHYAAVLRDLDVLEHCVPGDPGNLYDRVPRETLRPDGSRVRAWVYVIAERLAGPLRSGGTLVAEGDWRGRGRTSDTP
ncbi:gamma-glutamylcyclotransferase [Streptomyces sp. NA04227]|uniref:gamma-glutamylcyclotransferase family protein n=1 Tax=Streptomyces sp. NA04227 TaxID=2742136 RepID=UPI001592ABE3|nr:gamma-glutamylcyclotransferase family protein [Streptomyces sp. NA04227]QKW06353.1 gamma-glutamylcyclotransferase [Streptomyces sp. NA04227]